MKKWWLLGSLFVFATCVNGQNSILFSHYMFNPGYFNPAWIGSETKGFVAFQHRSQWAFYDTSFDGPGGSPTTQLLSAVLPFDEDFFISGTGLNVSLDDLGPTTNFQIQVPVTYSFSFRRGNLSIGVAPTLFSQTIKADELRPNEPGDPAIPTGGNQTEMEPDLSAGIFFTARNSLFLGVSAIHILEPGFSYGLDDLENKQNRSYAMHGGYTFQINNKITLSPSFLLRTNLKSYTFDMGAILNINNKMWGGLSYRRQESAIVYVGYSLLEDNKLKIGYAFDLVIQGRDAKETTSHEIFVRYDLPDLIFGGRKAVKTPRFSY